MSEWELCQKFADFVYKGQSKWLWCATDEIKERDIVNNAKWQSVYDARICALERKHESPDLYLSFDRAVASPQLKDAAGDGK
jgi:hypothetical protein